MQLKTETTQTMLQGHWESKVVVFLFRQPFFPFSSEPMIGP